MKHFVRNLFSVLLCAVLCCSMMPAYAAEGPTASAEVSGSAIPNDGTLRIPFGTAGSLGLDVHVSGTTSVLREYFIGWNRTLKLETEASTESGSVAAYQWYAVPRKQLSYDDTALTFPDSCAIQDATSSSYTPPVISADTVITYVCAVTDSNGDTAAAAFTIEPVMQRSIPYPQNGPNGIVVKNIVAISIGQGYEYRDPFLSPDAVHPDDEELSSATKYLISRRCFVKFLMSFICLS